MKCTSEYPSMSQTIELLHQGGHLLKTHTSTGREWQILPSGDRIKSRDASKIVERPDIRSMDDGLLPGCGQTWACWGSK
jgi:hypothetical protein